jgi:hypothetical protein
VGWFSWSRSSDFCFLGRADDRGADFTWNWKRNRFRFVSALFTVRQPLEANSDLAIVPAFIQESSVGTEQGRSQDILLTVGLGVLGIAAANWVDYGMFKSGQSSYFSAKYLC